MQQCVYQTKICDIIFDFEQNVIDAVIDQRRDRLRSCLRAGGGHFETMLYNYCSFVLRGSSEHFVKLLL